MCSYIKPIVSVVSPAIKIDFWKEYYDGLQENYIPFEVIFIGHIRPDFELPENFRYIYAEVKPAQCFHIGMLEARGDFIFNSGDDLSYPNKNALDCLYDHLIELGNNEYNFSAGALGRYIYKPKIDKFVICKRASPSRFFFGKRSGKHLSRGYYCPFLPNGAGLMFHKEAYFKLGGIDKNFICSYYAEDFAMRLYEAGGQSIYVKEVRTVENNEGYGSISPSLAARDAALFSSLWCEWRLNSSEKYGIDRIIRATKRQVERCIVVARSKRSDPVATYVNDKKLTTISQGRTSEKWDLSLELYKKIYLIRKAESVIIDNYFDDEMKTPMHMSRGEEAISVGIIGALNDDDQIFTTYRTHAPYLAKTRDTHGFFAEMYGKKTGEARGKAGSMHIACPEEGYMSSSAIVASNISVATGAAFANKMKKNGRVVVVFFGDGAVDEGNFWESINMASLWQLPVLFVYEDNDLAVCTSKKERHGYDDICDFMDNFRLTVHNYKTTKVDHIYHDTKKIVEDIRATNRPHFMSFNYLRCLEHVGVCDDWEAGYRSRDELNKVEDPLEYSRDLLLKDHPDLDIEKVNKEIDEQIYRSLEFAKVSESSDVSELYNNVLFE
ncbi:MAG: thiamine pyrophosphate-dependent enzyme [Candidatus Asgardarchaeia archaeon]